VIAGNFTDVADGFAVADGRTTAPGAGRSGDGCITPSGCGTRTVPPSPKLPASQEPPKGNNSSADATATVERGVPAGFLCCNALWFIGVIYFMC
jgi:hypothetical protein